ncbi:MAG: DUF6588 family protein [Endomicrobiales bacterium]|jgi:hypothetical protein
MKKLLYFLLLCIITSSNSFGANPFDGFINQISGVATSVAQKNLNNFTQDLGEAIDGGEYHQAQVLGCPGFDVGIQVPVVTVNNNDTIIKAAGISSVAFPLIQAEIGLPGKIDLIGRVTGYDNASMYGVGLRYGLFKGDMPGVPSLSVQSIYNSLTVTDNANKFTATSWSTSLVASMGLLIVDPYLGVGYDMTTLVPGSSIALPQAGMKGTANEARIEGGVNLTLFPFTYLKLGAVLVDSQVGYDAGFGVKF